MCILHEYRKCSMNLHVHRYLCIHVYISIYARYIVGLFVANLLVAKTEYSIGKADEFNSLSFLLSEKLHASYFPGKLP